MKTKGKSGGTWDYSDAMKAMKLMRSQPGKALFSRRITAAAELLDFYRQVA